MAAVAAAMSASCGASGSGTTAQSLKHSESPATVRSRKLLESVPQPGSRPMTWMPARITSPLGLLLPATAASATPVPTRAAATYTGSVSRSVSRTELQVRRCATSASSTPASERAASPTTTASHPSPTTARTWGADVAPVSRRTGRIGSSTIARAACCTLGPSPSARTTRWSIDPGTRPRGIWPADSRRAPRAHWSAPCELVQYVTMAITICTHATSRARTTRQERWQVAGRCRTTTLAP